MKSALAMVVVMLLFAAPAFAGDGNVSQGTLSSLGLGDMQVVSDAEGMQVRGAGSNASFSFLAVFSGLLYDPDTGSVAPAFKVFSGAASAENAGKNAKSQVEIDFNALDIGVAGAITITGGFKGTFGSAAGGFFSAFAK